VVTPVTNDKLKSEIRFMLDAQLNDYRQAWEMQSDGTYIQRMPRNANEEVGCQQIMINRHKERSKVAKRYQLGKTLKKIIGRNLR
jgi:polyphosphate kinase